MADVIYVPKSDILDLITEEYTAGGFTDYSNYSNLWDEVDDMPAADIQPAKCGKWILKENAILTGCECSLCKCSVSIPESKFYKFCPYCGARMNGDTECQ